MPKKRSNSALNIQKGIDQPPQINQEGIERHLSRKPIQYSSQEYIDGIISGNRLLLSKAITLIESSLPAHQQIAQEIISGCLNYAERKGQRAGGSAQNTETSSVRIGITGVPGAGKSTFIEALGSYITKKGHQLAVLAIDPSSSRTGGSILGDKTRMEHLSADPHAFIRPSPSAGSLGGVARKTRETILLCEAAGFDVIFVETVGVGQSETAVKSMVDFFLLLMIPGAGDELQGIKRGIIEMADCLVINKADGDNMVKADLAANQYRTALHLFPPAPHGWNPPVVTCSSLQKTGIDDIWEIILKFQNEMVANGYFRNQRIFQNRDIFFHEIGNRLRENFFGNPENKVRIDQLKEEVAQGLLNPYAAVQKLFS